MTQPPAEPLRAAVREVGALTRFASKAARAARARARTRARSGESEAGRLAERGADLRLRRSLLAWVPGAGFAVRRLDAAAEANRRDERAARDRSSCEWQRAERLSRLSLRLDAAAGRLPDLLAAGTRLGSPPTEVEARLAALASRCAHMRRKGFPGMDPDGTWAAAACSLADDLPACLKDWAAHHRGKLRAEAEAARRRKEALRTAPARRLYLPIPPSLSDAARRAGAVRADDAPQGASPWFVPPGTPLAPFGRMLPLVARTEPVRLSFPPVPYRAAGQNLWGLFDADTWTHVRKQAYAASGRRCAVCGGRSEGFLADRLYDERERLHPIECHEVWDWRVPREADGLGVQRLRHLLVVCRNCHPMFHSAFFMRRARAEGIADEVAAAIEKRRMLVTRQTRAQLSSGLASAAENLARASGVDTWVVDLSHLSAQGFMANANPVLLESNDAGLTPERVAGLSFVTDRGRSFPQRTVDDILSGLRRQDVEREATASPRR